MRLRLLALIGVFAAFCVAAGATTPLGYLTITGSHLTDFTGSPISNATITWAPVDNYGNALPAQINGAGQGITMPVSANVTSGAFTIQVADTALTSPKNVCYKVTVTDSTTGNITLANGYTCVQPAGSGTAVTGSNAWCTAATGSVGGACNFDLYVPNLAGQVVVQTGPAGAAGAGACSLTGSSDPPSLTCSSSVNTQCLYQSTALSLYSCTNLTGSYQWNKLTVSTTYPGVASDGASGLAINGGESAGGITPPAGAPTGTVSDVISYSPNDEISVLDYGGRCDAFSSSVSISSSSSTLNGGGFTSSLVGKTIVVPGAGSAGGFLTTTVSAYISSTQLTLSASASTTVSAVTAWIGTDDTGPINTAQTSFQSVGGGTLTFPLGVCLIAGHIVLPNDNTNWVTGGGVTTPAYARQSPIAWRGLGGTVQNGIRAQPTAVYHGSELLMAYPGNGSDTAKIETYGLGRWKVSDIQFYDPLGDAQPFFLTTGTTLVFRDNGFVGSKSGTANNQDVFLLGGFNNTGSGSLNSPTNAFQGYDTVIGDNWFNNIRRAVLGGTWLDHLKFEGNLIDAGAGTNITNGGAVEIGGSSVVVPNNNMFTNNRCEMVNYYYCFKFIASNNNFIGFNDAEDGNVGTTGIAITYFDATSADNIMISTVTGGSPVIPAVDASTAQSNVVISNYSTANPTTFPLGLKTSQFTIQNTPVTGLQFNISNVTPATSSTNSAAGLFEAVNGQYWTGTASAQDSWQFWQGFGGTGANPVSTFSLVHSGSSAAPTVKIPYQTFFGGSQQSNFDGSGDLTLGSAATVNLGSTFFLSVAGGLQESTFLARNSGDMLSMQGRKSSGNGSTPAIQIINGSTLGSTDIANQFGSAGGTNWFNVFGDGSFTSSGVSAFKSQTAIASATTLAPTAQRFHVTGTTAIATITAPSGCTRTGFICALTLIPDGLWTTTTGGNIALATTAVVSKALIMTYDPATSLWYPSY